MKAGDLRSCGKQVEGDEAGEGEGDIGSKRRKGEVKKEMMGRSRKKKHSRAGCGRESRDKLEKRRKSSKGRWLRK